jgi:hypothetical protein
MPSNGDDDVFVYLPPTTGILIGEFGTQNLHDKIIDGSNTVTASILKMNNMDPANNGSCVVEVEIVGHTYPVTGQVLTLVSPDKAAWMTPAAALPIGVGSVPGSGNGSIQKPAPGYITTRALTFNIGVWERLTTNTRGAGQIIFSSVKSDLCSQLVVFVAKSNSKTNEFTIFVACECSNTIQVRWNAGNGVEAKGSGEYIITTIGMIGTPG